MNKKVLLKSLSIGDSFVDVAGNSWTIKRKVGSNIHVKNIECSIESVFSKTTEVYKLEKRNA